MGRDWLAEQLSAGRSIESIAREVGKDPSTVGYWVRKHGLVSVHAERHTNRGALDRAGLEELVARGLTTREIAAAVERSQGTVRHWLKRYGLKTDGARRIVVDGENGARDQLRICRSHGETTHRLRGDGAYRCLRCRSEAVAEWRRRVKQRLVAECGGGCALCGYARHAAVLQFHHLDPSTKVFAIGSRGLGRALAELRAEAAKCVLLCPTCHVEVELGAARLPMSLPLRGSSDPG